MRVLNYISMFFSLLVVGELDFCTHIALIRFQKIHFKTTTMTCYRSDMWVVYGNIYVVHYMLRASPHAHVCAFTIDTFRRAASAIISNKNAVVLCFAPS